jgi:hypothetical protein
VELALIYNCAQKNDHTYSHDIPEGNNGYPSGHGSSGQEEIIMLSALELTSMYTWLQI